MNCDDAVFVATVLVEIQATFTFVLIGRILWANIFQFRCHRSPSNFHLYKSIEFDTISKNFNVVTRTNLQFLSI